jgi:hypothetical protein
MKPVLFQPASKWQVAHHRPWRKIGIPVGPLPVFRAVGTLAAFRAAWFEMRATAEKGLIR